MQVQHMGPMMMRIAGACNDCQGKGERVIEVCTACTGTGYLADKRTLSVNIAPGTKADEVVIFSEVCSDHVAFERPGDVHIQIVEDKSDTAYATYRRTGARSENLETTVEICLSESLLGCVVTLENHPGYDEGLHVSLPAGSFHGDTIVLTGFGMPTPGSMSQYGDLLLQVKVRAKIWERSLFAEHAEEALGEWFRDKVRAMPAAGENIHVARFVPKRIPHKRHLKSLACLGGVKLDVARPARAQTRARVINVKQAGRGERREAEGTAARATRAAATRAGRLAH